MIDTIETFVDRWDDKTLNMNREASLLAFDIICKILFG